MSAASDAGNQQEVGDRMGANELYGSGSFGDLIVSALARFPERIAFVNGPDKVTYRQAQEAISRLVQWFAAKGLKRGDTVVQLCRNSPEQWFIVAAIYIAGLRSVTLNPMGSRDDHVFIINDSEATIVVTDNSYAEQMAEYRRQCPQVSAWYCHGQGDHLPCLWTEADKFTPRRLQSLSGPEDIIRLAYTGGTTGRSKGAMLSNRAMVTAAMVSLADSDWPENPRVLCVTPISHGAGNLIVPALFRGGTIFLHKGFDKDAFLNAVREDKISVIFCVPTLLYTLLDYPKTRESDLSSLRLVIYGAAPMSPTRIKEALEVFGPVLCQRYGQTEAPSSICNLRIVDHKRPELLSSCGRPFPGLQVAILDDNGERVAQGGIGEVCVRGPIVMSGYWKQPEMTAEVFRNGWLHTGDMAREDEQGYFFIVDRKKDMIITGGFNVYPREVEDVLTACPGVAAAAVVGVADPKWGEAVIAFVQPRPGMQIDDAVLKKLVRERKGPVNTPKHIELVDKMPVTALGKPDKKQLRAMYKAPAGE
ncbi:MAG: AMP-binding protein [Pseudorhodoplanes sp.]